MVCIGSKLAPQKMALFCICFFFIMTNLFNHIIPVQSLNVEGISLLNFKQSVIADPLHSLDNWTSSDANPCAWNGVTCNGETVVSLALPDKRLSGMIPPALGKLSALRHLNLRSNNLSGRLPAELFDSVGLQTLVVSENSFFGSVPEEIGKLSSLHILDFSSNSFEGGIPSLLIRCRSLNVLDLSKNSFSGPLPSNFGSSLQLLQTINLSFNEFNGSIPSDIGDLSNLRGTLDLSNNFFSGPIPETLGRLSQNVCLDLSYNNLSGPIPQNDPSLNSGPTAFLGNPSLCGLPLKQPCSALKRPQNIYIPSVIGIGTSDQRERHGGFSVGVLIAVVASATIGSCFIGLLLSYMLKKSNTCNGCESVQLCLRQDSHCHDTISITEKLEAQLFVPLDLEVDFDMEKLLRASAFLLRRSETGIMYKVVLENGQNLAVRRLNGDSQSLKEFQPEVEAVAKIRHLNIVPLRAYYWSPDEKLLIYDFTPNGNLADTIHGKDDMVTLTPLSWTARLRIMKEVAKALAYIHEFSPKKFVHGNLKPSNILLGARMEAYIADFGINRLARVASSSNESMSSIPLEQVLSGIPEQCSSSFSSPYDQPTPIVNRSTENSRSYHQAPEALRRPTARPSQKWDVYSFGKIVLELVTAKVADFDLVQWVQKSVNERTPVSDMADPLLVHDLDKEEEILAAAKLGLACVRRSAERRPSMRQALNRLNKIG